MKRIIYISIIATLIMSGCKPEVDAEIGEPFDKVVGISGTWELTSFIQKDWNNPVKEERDLSDFYITPGETPLTIDFTAPDRSYAVAISQGKNFFGEGGTWSYDNDQYPTNITFDDGVTANTFSLGSVVREFDNTLVIELVKGCSEEELNVIYKFNFQRGE